MARFNINVNKQKLKIDKEETITDCASIFIYEIIASPEDNLYISLEGEYKHAIILSSTEENSFIDNISVSYTEPIYLKIVIENSGNPGFFNEVKLSIKNVTEDYTYKDAIIRRVDAPKCKNDDIISFDILNDTPNTKAGSAHKIVRVNGSENSLEYVGVDDIITQDLNYTHIQDDPSDEWICEHNLNKYPSVSVLDSAKTEVEGHIKHISKNTTILKFSGSFSGIATFN